MRRKGKNLYDELARELIQPEMKQLVLTGVTTDGGIDLLTKKAAWTNPMSAEWDLIRGGESGAALALPMTGTDGQVLTVQPDGSLDYEDLPTSSYTDEQVRDVIGVALVGGTGITVTPNDGADTITVATTITQYTDEQVRDAIGAALVGGANITITPNDGGDTITIDVSGLSSYSDEQARDAIGTALVAGNNIDITVNDVGDTITIEVEVLTSADLTDFIEAVQDAISASAGAGFLVDTSSIAWTYSDPTPSLVANVKDEYVRDTIAAALVAGQHVQISVNDPADTITISAEVTAFGGIMPGVVFGGWVSQNNYALYQMVAGAGVSASANALTADEMVASLFPIPVATSFDQISITVSTLVNPSTIRLGVYAVGTDGKPGALIADWGTVSSSTTGQKTLSISWSPAVGWYYIVMSCSAGAAVLRFSGGMGVAPFGNPSGSVAIGGVTDWTKAAAGSSAALPNPFGSSPGATGTHRPTWLRKT